MGRLPSLDEAALRARLGPDVTAPEFAGYWRACAEHVLVTRSCRACGGRSWPPRPACPVCGSEDVRWLEIAARGTLYSWTVVGKAMSDAYSDLTPYAVGIVELVDAPGVRMVGRLVPETLIEELRIGLPLIAVFVERDGVTLPLWRAS